MRAVTAAAKVGFIHYMPEISSKDRPHVLAHDCHCFPVVLGRAVCHRGADGVIVRPS